MVVLCYNIIGQAIRLSPQGYKYYHYPMGSPGEPGAAMAWSGEQCLLRWVNVVNIICSCPGAVTVVVTVLCCQLLTTGHQQGSGQAVTTSLALPTPASSLQLQPAGPTLQAETTGLMTWSSSNPHHCLPLHHSGQLSFSGCNSAMMRSTENSTQHQNQSTIY